MAPSSSNRKRRIVSAAERQTDISTIDGVHPEDGLQHPDDTGQSHHADSDDNLFNDDILDDGDEYDEDEGVNAPLIPSQEDEEGEDLFGENMEADYKEMPHLDTYTSSQLDDAEYDPMDLQDRRRIEEELNRRDQELARRQGRIPEMFLPDSNDVAVVKFDSRRVNRQLMMEQQQQDDLIMGSDLMLNDEDMLSPEAITEAEAAGYSLREFLTLENCRRRVARDYQAFLTTYMDEHGHSVYNSRIRDMCAANQESLEVSYEHLANANAFLAKLLAHCPRETLKIFDAATFKVVLEQFPEYHRIKCEIHVRICELPTMDNLRDLRYSHLNALVRVCGVVTRRSGVFPQLKLVKFDCARCGAILGPFTQDLAQEIRVGACPECSSRGPFNVNDTQTVYRNYQTLTLQESPGSVPAGRLPRHKEVVLLWDLIDSVRPGEEIEITGIYMNNYSYALNTRHGFPVFATVVEANHLTKRADRAAALRLTEDDRREIRALSNDPKLARRIIRSIAPSIYGHETVKTAIALSMFGGQPKTLNGGKHTVRGDINVLLMGDPGTAKSQFLKYVEMAAPRAIYTTGQGASAVGLTAAVRKDPATREWTLEGGALVLADRGVCLIDEFDKMGDADRTSIHEAMEQQSISISKAGIVATLQARCAVIAAANPVRGRYNPALTFAQNVALSDPILSRFDALCVVRDIPDPIVDGLLARFVVGSHMRHHTDYISSNSHQTVHTFIEHALTSSSSASVPSEDVPMLVPQSLLKKYILYARSNVFPTIRVVDVDRIAKLYADLRQESLSSGGIAITVRHVESMVRMAEASARLHLRQDVNDRDIDLAIRVMLESFIASQKFAVMKRLTKAFSRYITTSKDHFELLLFTLQEMMRDTLKYYKYRYDESHMPSNVEISLDEFEGKARELNFSPDILLSFYGSQLFSRTGFRMNAPRRIIEIPTNLRNDD